jgi:hypothetical protein
MRSPILKRKEKNPANFCLNYTKEIQMDPIQLLQNQWGGFTFKSDGHPAQSMTLKAKKENNANDKYENIFSFSDH